MEVQSRSTRHTPSTLLLALLVGISSALVGASSAHASQLVARNVSHATIAVNSAGTAMVQYQDTASTWHHVLYWSGLNASLTFAGADYTGGDHSHRAAWQTFTDRCGDYTGPQLLYVVDACTAPDGSSWVLQQWERVVPDYGGASGPSELRLSHFTGAPASLWIATDWEHGGAYEHLYGTLTYQGKPWFGLSSTSTGYVLDKRGRNIAIDSWNSDYGAGWRRVNAFLSDAPSGQFCFGFMPKGGSPDTGRSATETYFASVPGPGVSPDVFMLFHGQNGAYDRQTDAVANYWQNWLTQGVTGGSCANVN